MNGVFTHLGGMLLIEAYKVCLIVPKDAIAEGGSEEITLKVLTEIPDALPIRNDEMLACFGFKCSPSGLKFRQGLKIVLPHCAVLAEPRKAQIVLYTSLKSKPGK